MNSSLIAEKLTRPKSGPIFDFTGTTHSPFVDLQSFYRVKPVSLLLFTRFLQGQICLPFPIYNVITGSNQSPFFDLQGFYWVKSVSLFQFTVLLQGYPASRLHFRCVSWCAKRSLCRQPFSFPSCMREIRHAIHKQN